MIKKEIKILYLDQFATSNLVQENKGIWLELKELIDLGIKNNRLLCPIPHDHFIETSQAIHDKALKIDEFFSKLSKGYMFKSTAFTNSQIIISILRKNNLTHNTFIYDGIKENILSKKENFEFYKQRKSEFNKMIEECTFGVNNLRCQGKRQKIEKKNKQSFYEIYFQLTRQDFIGRLKDLLREGRITIQGDKFSFIEIPNWIDQIIYRLVKVHRINPKETKQLISMIQKYGFSKFPTLDIRFSLYAIMSIEGKKENPGDHIDIERIATGLPISDFFLIDKQRKSEIIDLELDTKYNTKVFSGTQSDLIELKVELEKIL